MSYAKRPDYACEQCHRSFKNERALKAHNKDVHGKSVQEIPTGPTHSGDHIDPSRRSGSVSDGDESNR